jgi:hypothetical protein
MVKVLGTVIGCNGNARTGKGMYGSYCGQSRNIARGLPMDIGASIMTKSPVVTVTAGTK